MSHRDADNTVSREVGFRRPPRRSHFMEPTVCFDAKRAAANEQRMRLSFSQDSTHAHQVPGLTVAHSGSHKDLGQVAVLPTGCQQHRKTAKSRVGVTVRPLTAPVDVTFQTAARSLKCEFRSVNRKDVSSQGNGGSDAFPQRGRSVDGSQKRPKKRLTRSPPWPRGAIYGPLKTLSADSVAACIQSGDSEGTTALGPSNPSGDATTSLESGTIFTGCNTRRNTVLTMSHSSDTGSSELEDFDNCIGDTPLENPPRRNALTRKASDEEIAEKGNDPSRKETRCSEGDFKSELRIQKPTEKKRSETSPPASVVDKENVPNLRTGMIGDRNQRLLGRLTAGSSSHKLAIQRGETLHRRPFTAATEKRHKPGTIRTQSVAENQRPETRQDNPHGGTPSKAGSTGIWDLHDRRRGNLREASLYERPADHKAGLRDSLQAELLAAGGGSDDLNGIQHLVVDLRAALPCLSKKSCGREAIAVKRLLTELAKEIAVCLADEPIRNKVSASSQTSPRIVRRCLAVCAGVACVDLARLNGDRSAVSPNARTCTVSCQSDSISPGASLPHVEVPAAKPSIVGPQSSEVGGGLEGHEPSAGPSSCLSKEPVGGPIQPSAAAVLQVLPTEAEPKSGRLDSDRSGPAVEVFSTTGGLPFGLHLLGDDQCSRGFRDARSRSTSSSESNGSVLLS